MLWPVRLCLAATFPTCNFPMPVCLTRNTHSTTRMDMVPGWEDQPALTSRVVTWTAMVAVGQERSGVAKEGVA